jgi:hypothetical protein
MKNLTVAIAFCLISWASQAQDYYIGKGANEFLNEGMKFGSRHISMELHLLESKEKDINGNPVISFEFFCKDGPAVQNRKSDTLTFIPSQSYYPTHYIKYYNKYTNQKEFEFDSDGFRLGTKYDMGKELYFLPNKKPNFIDDISISGHSEWITINNIDKNKNDDGYRKFYSLDDTKKTVKEGDYYLDVVEKHISAILEQAKTEDYKQKMTDFFKDGDLFYLIDNDMRPEREKGTYAFDEFKVKTVKGADNKLSSFKMQFPYNDGKYYEKEDFFSNVTTDKNFSNMFRINDKKLIIKDGILVPYEDLILVITKSNNGAYMLRGYISKTTYHATINSLMNKEYGTLMLSNSYLQEIGYRIENYYTWFKKKTLATSYKSETDILRFEVFILKYLNALVFKK